MFGFLIENLGTIVIGLALICAISAIVAKMVRDKKRGKCIGCDGVCAGGACGGADFVHDGASCYNEK